MDEGSIHFLQKMIFIYNAVINGWTVKKINGEYQFTKDSHSSSGDLNDFLKSNIQIPEELKKITDSVLHSLQNFI